MANTLAQTAGTQRLVGRSWASTATLPKGEVSREVEAALLSFENRSSAEALAEEDGRNALDGVFARSRDGALDFHDNIFPADEDVAEVLSKTRP